MFTEQILKSILSLRAFCNAKSAHTPELEGIHISVNAETKTITAIATDRYAAARMVISMPEVVGTSWDRNVSIATLNAALATVKAGGSPVSVFPEAYMPEFPNRVSSIIDTMVSAKGAEDGGDFNAKYLGAIAKINIGGDRSGRWTIRTVAQGDNTAMAATAAYGSYEVAVAVMPLTIRN